MSALSFTINRRRIEAAWHGPAPDQAPTLVLLHEGLGSVAMWKEFPRILAERTGYGVLTYSRFGYGKSDPAPLPRPVSYMHQEALEVLPAVLDQAHIRNAILIGHSDGASIATIYAGGAQDFRIHGLVLMAPHFFVEDISIRSIAAVKTVFEQGVLRDRLAKYHDDVDGAFRGWNDVWLNPDFRAWRIDDSVAHVRVPTLIIQGREDEYGTLAQVKLAEDEAYCPVETLILDRCKHAPQVDQPVATVDAISAFVHRVLALHEGLIPV
ncbi:MAG TPA: alpha/beta hydrolase [Xanthobacteraceae bacterium]|jgi:pimeloyl-ACP methyl ester carboxylesterase|nr:alpha/beta hydrolase [Xanthobacteraceae bacterium]